MKQISPACLLLIIFYKTTLHAQTLTNRDVYGSLKTNDVMIMQPQNILCAVCEPVLQQPYRLVFNGWDDTSNVPGIWYGSYSQYYDCTRLAVIDSPGGIVDTVVYYSFNNTMQPTATIPLIINGIDSNYNPLTTPLRKNFISNIDYSCGSNAQEIVYSTGNNGNISYYTKITGAEGLGDIAYCDSTDFNNGNTNSTITSQMIYFGNNDTCYKNGFNYVNNINSVGLSLSEVYDFEVGDEFLYSYYYGSHGGGGLWYSSTDYEYIKITAKTVIADSLIYTVDKRYVDYDNNGGIISDTFMQGQRKVYANTGYINIYFPEDINTFSFSDDRYLIKEKNCNSSQIRWAYTTNEVYPLNEQFAYAKGLGQTWYESSRSSQYSSRNTLVYYKKNSATCGDFIPLNNENAKMETDNFRLYPTVTTDVFLLKANNYNCEHCYFTIHNVNGKIVNNREIIVSKNDADTYQFQINNLPNGIYFLNIANGSKSLTTKVFIKQ